MHKLQFILAWRNILKRKFYSSIEILGLAVGIACFFIILLYVKKEFSYDKFFKDYDKIYRVLNHERGNGNRYSGGASAIGHHASTEVLQVEDVVRIFWPYKMFSSSALVRYEDKRFYEDKIIDVDSNFFSFFDFRVIEGDISRALTHPNSIVITDRAAKKLFGNESALGKLISIDNDHALQVTAVVHMPDNTHLDFDYARPSHRLPQQLYVWQQTLAFTYLKVKNKQDIASVEKQLYNIILKHATDEDAEYLKNYLQQLQPLTDIHTTVINWDIYQPVSAKQLWAILAIAVLILLLAIINFINLATARAAERMKESGISKILGASKRRLVLQFFTEYWLVTCFAGLIALFFLGGIIDIFNGAVNSSLAVKDFATPAVGLLFVGILAVTALLSGMYPAYQLSGFKPTQVIKRVSTASKGQQHLRHVLVITQFVISIGLLSGTFIIQKQIEFMQQTDLGFENDNIYVLRLRHADRSQFERLKTDILNHPGITKVAGASALLGGEPGSDTFHPDHMPQQTPETFAKNIAVDANFLQLINVPLLQGRNFKDDHATDYRTAYILNETAIKQYQLHDPIDANLRRSGDTEGKVIGVMKDFHFAKMNERINPMIFFMDSVLSYRYMFIKMEGDLANNINIIEQSWSKLMPEYPIEGFFMDQYFNALYKQEQQVSKITTSFSVLAMLLACLGLLGMSSFTTLQRTKEIGIRKVVGASVKEIVVLLTGGFVKLLIIALLISIPLTLYITDLWLQDFVVRTPVSAFYFIAAACITFVIGLFTIGYQTIKAALTNPVESLKQE
jgi:putative ABC transport system permease protein